MITVTTYLHHLPSFSIGETLQNHRKLNTLYSWVLKRHYHFRNGYTVWHWFFWLWLQFGRYIMISLPSSVLQTEYSTWVLLYTKHFPVLELGDSVWLIPRIFIFFLLISWISLCAFLCWYMLWTFKFLKLNLSCHGHFVFSISRM